MELDGYTRSDMFVDDQWKDIEDLECEIDALQNEVVKYRKLFNCGDSIESEQLEIEINILEEQIILMEEELRWLKKG